ncbi:hypothetical protein IE53DRAFT_25822 [Violaceomyces palustris]|uniref:Uncharacterized protein n=1 Tax=Violaceomyces palustris TaxID=1673888 RepID=A0ACD0P1L8_9BASI|nr:hypothetical protein IE53DRAFT_25822 [Violaceomyces palustris]
MGRNVGFGAHFLHSRALSGCSSSEGGFARGEGKFSLGRLEPTFHFFLFSFSLVKKVGETRIFKPLQPCAFLPIIVHFFFFFFFFPNRVQASSSTITERVGA